MACGASTLINGAASNGYYGLEDRSVLLAMAGLLSGLVGLTASQAMSGAAYSGFYGLQDEQLYDAIIALCT